MQRENLSRQQVHMITYRRQLAECNVTACNVNVPCIVVNVPCINCIVMYNNNYYNNYDCVIVVV